MSRATRVAALASLSVALCTHWGCSSEILFSDSPVLTGSGGDGGATTVQGPGGAGPVGPGPGPGPGPGGAGAAGGDGGAGGAGAAGPGGRGGAGGSAPECGNGVIESGEECDTPALGGDCTDFGYSNPAGLVCAGCAHDPSGCVTTCDGVLEPGEPCDDGNNNPNDGCDQCTLAPTTGTCASPIAVAVPAGATVVTGTTVGGGSQTTDQCQGEAMAPDVVYAVTPAADGFLTASLSDTGTDYDSMLYVMKDCADTSSGVLCVDNFPNGKETLSFRVSANTTYHLVVDGWSGAAGSYTLDLDLSAGTCADPVPFPLWPGIPMDAAGTTTGLGNDHVSTTCGGSLSSDVVYELLPQFTGPVAIDIIAADTSFNTVLAAREACGMISTQIDCDVDNGGNEHLSLTATNGQPIYVWVDGWSGANGSYYLQMAPE